MEIIWHGTASLELVNSIGKLLIDPFVPMKGSDVDVSISEYDHFSDILITHGHFDHIFSIPEIVRRNPRVQIYCSRTPSETLRAKGVPAENMHIIEYGQELEIQGFKVRAIHGRHAVLPRVTMSRLLYAIKSPARRNLPLMLKENRICMENDETLFYQIQCDGKSLAVMGSMNLREEVEYPVNADLLILPYNGWEDNLPPAIKTIEKLKPQRVLLDHYDDTFPPITQPLDLQPVLDKYKVRPGYVQAMKVRERYQL